jgi:hypothetical protein
MSAYIGDVVKNGLVLYLDAANSKSYVSGSGVWRDLSGNNNSGSLTNGPTFSSDGKGSIIFDGTNDHIIASASSVWNISTGTIECWVMVSGDVGYRGIFGSFTASFTGYAFAINSLSTKLEFLVGYGIGQSFKYIQSNENYVKNRWYHLAGTFGSGGALFYVDGVLQTDKTTTAVGAPGNLPLTIGRFYHDTNDYYFNGRVASGKIYNRILSAAEILENYNATKGRFDTPRVINSVQPRLVTNGLVMCLDAGNRESYVSGSSTIFDLSGNGYNGTLTNGPTFNSSNNGSIVLDGTNDYITRSNVIRIGGSNQKMTVEAAFFIPTGGGGWIATNERETGQTGHGWYYCTTASCFFEQHARNSSPYTYITFASSTGLSYIRSNDWNIVSWSVEVGTTSMFCNFLINGYTETIANNSITISNEITTEDNIDIGRWRNAGYSTEYSSIRIANVRIYNRALNRNEQIQNYNALKGRFGL